MHQTRQVAGPKKVVAVQDHDTVRFDVFPATADCITGAPWLLLHHGHPVRKSALATQVGFHLAGKIVNNHNHTINLTG